MTRREIGEANSEDFKTEARRAAAAWKQSTASLPDEARRHGKYRQFAALEFCLPAEHAELNLLPAARSIALDRFESAGVRWHDGGSRPSNHLVSSQVQCLNALAPLVRDPGAIKSVFGRVLPIDEVLPFGAQPNGKARVSEHESDDFVVFEWQGLDDHLNEWTGRPTRGSRATSADAAFRYRSLDGTIELALVEWKYTESYPSGSLHGSTTANETRRERYQSLLEAPDGPIDLSVLSLEDMLADPVYQLMRLALLAARCEHVGELGIARARVVYVAPFRNGALWASPGSERFTQIRTGYGLDLVSAWRRCLRNPATFRVLDSACLDASDAPTSDDFKERYAHLAVTRTPTSSDAATVHPRELHEVADDPWNAAIPALYRCIGDGHDLTSFDLVRPRCDADPWSAGGYWVPFLHLLSYFLGWADPGAGMRWWRTSGYAHHVPLLAAAERIWNIDDELDLITAWLSTPSAGDMQEDEIDGWLQALRAVGDLIGPTSPFSSGGRDPLHLAAHAYLPEAEDAEPTLQWLSEDSVAISTTIEGWYQGLHSLPAECSSAAVHIDGLGEIGVFRWSTASSRWFSCEEWVHLKGC